MAKNISIRTLGTNGWYDTATGNTLCTLITSSDANIVLDAGNGLYKLDRYISAEKPTYIFISHMHLDHIIGFHVLNKFDFPEGITIVTEKGNRPYLEAFIKHPYTASLNELTTKTRIIEIGDGVETIPYLEKSLPLIHPDPCLGYRFKIDGKIISYTTDTGICDNLIELAKNADLLIAECAYAPGKTSSIWPHLNPEIAANAAKTANAKTLLLTHFDANQYKKLSDRDDALKIAKNIFPKTFAATDEMEIKL